MHLQPHIAELETLVGDLILALPEPQQDCIRHMLRQKDFRSMAVIQQKWMMDRNAFARCTSNAVQSIRVALAAAGIYSMDDFREL
jgi:hypothetical protein